MPDELFARPCTETSLGGDPTSAVAPACEPAIRAVQMLDANHIDTLITEAFLAGRVAICENEQQE